MAHTDSTGSAAAAEPTPGVIYLANGDTREARKVDDGTASGRVEYRVSAGKPGRSVWRVASTGRAGTFWPDAESPQVADMRDESAEIIARRKAHNADATPLTIVRESGPAPAAGQSVRRQRAAVVRKATVAGAVTLALKERESARAAQNFPNVTKLGSPVWARPAEAAETFRHLASVTTGAAQAFWTVQAEVCEMHAEATA